MSLIQAPLKGIRVVDMTRVLAGPFCTMILGDLGAEILKIEQPKVGDETRHWGPPFKGPETCYYLSINRDKQSIAIDIKKPAGRRIIEQLVMQSDVFVENYVPGKLDSFGLGRKQLTELKRDLIYCSVSGFGQQGPYHDRPGYDVVAAAMGGFMHITGPQDGAPCNAGVSVTDIMTGMFSCIGILASLIGRAATGSGQLIDCNLLNTQVAMLTHIASNWLNAGVEGRRWGTGHNAIVPYQAFLTKDDHYLVIGAGSDKHFTVLCKLLELPEVGKDARFTSNALRVKNRNALIPLLAQRVKMRPMHQWLERFENSGLPYGPINTIPEVFSDPHVLQSGMIKHYQHPTAGDVQVIGTPIIFGNNFVIEDRPPPLLGQHTDSVLKSILNYGDDQIKKLRHEGAIA